MDEIVVVKTRKEWAGGPEEGDLQDETCKVNHQDLSRKEVDPSVVVLFISVCNMKVGNVLIDLGTSLNVIPISVVKRIKYLQIEPSSSTLQMAYKTCKTPIWMIKDVQVQINKFSFPLDFMILEIQSDPKMPLILGRPFMKIAKMLVDIDKGEIKVKIKDREVCYKVFGIT